MVRLQVPGVRLALGAGAALDVFAARAQLARRHFVAARELGHHPARVAVALLAHRPVEQVGLASEKPFGDGVRVIMEKRIGSG